MSYLSCETFRAASLAVLLLGAPVASCIAASSNTELRRIEEADQADRAAGSNKIDWDIVGKRDTSRRARTLEILKAGDVRTADDYLNAAVVFQHGEAIEDTELALALVTTASRIDANNKAAKVLVAQATDRILVKLGKPQWYGTQFSKNKSTGKWEMPPTDPAVISEEKRTAMGVPSLSDTKAHLDAINAN